jgi:hypothetical protein
MSYTYKYETIIRTATARYKLDPQLAALKIMKLISIPPLALQLATLTNLKLLSAPPDTDWP